LERRSEAMRSTAPSGRASSGDAGSVVLPIPASPWISVARTMAPNSAPAEPSATGTCDAP
jgi:hypothetical protein